MFQYRCRFLGHQQYMLENCFMITVPSGEECISPKIGCHNEEGTMTWLSSNRTPLT